VLNTCPRAHGAGYPHGNRQGCLTGTREAILDEIESWAKDFDMSPVYWLNGLAGTGKSTIAQTIAERLFADGQLGASFFCSCDFKDHGDLHLIFPTLSFQLAYRYPNFRSALIPLLQSTPDIGHESLCSQMEKLIVTPLKEGEISTVIVIDALDECTDNEPQSAILSVMGRFVEEIPEVKFFITGRPEPRIQSGFRLKLLRPLTRIYILHMVKDSIINEDIQRFLKAQLADLAHRFELTEWPSDEHINLLCKRAAGLFVYAVATVKFLDDKGYPPEQRLNAIIALPECTTYEGETQFKVNTTLDSLYTSILQMALDFGRKDPELDTKVQSIIGTVVLVVNPLPPSAVAELIGLEAKQVKMILTLVQSLLILNEDPTCPVKPFHKSFPDFITDPSRCLNKRFSISPSAHHYELTVSCLKLMNGALKQNLLSLPGYALNQEVKDLPERVKSYISPALQYACLSWYSHLTEIRKEEDTTCVLSALRFFLKHKFLPWLEVISVLGAARNGVVGFGGLIQWLQEVCLIHPKVLHITNPLCQVAKDLPNNVKDLVDIARDYSHFVIKFFEVIKLSAPHIYHSALELSPEDALVRQFYSQWLPGDIDQRVFFGLPDLWNQPMTIAGEYGSYTWSPCGQSFSARGLTSVGVWDVLTLEKSSTLQLTDPHTIVPWNAQYYSPDVLAYSPDGYYLAGCFGLMFTIWDIQTGGVVREIECGTANVLPKSLVWSSDGKMIGVIFPTEVGTWVVYMYDVALGVIKSTSELQSLLQPHLWSYNNSLYTMVVLSGEGSWAMINILNIWPIPTGNPVESFSISLNLQNEPPTISFSPATYRLSAVTYKGRHPYALLAFDIQSSKVLLQETDHFTANCLSPDGSVLVASGMNDNVYVWKYTSEQNYVILGKFSFWSGSRDGPRGYRFSPGSLSLLISRDNFLEIQHLDHPEVDRNVRKKYYGEFSINGNYVVTASYCGQTITITNLCANSSQYIDTLDVIYGLALTGNILLVERDHEIVGWRLTAEGMVDEVSDDRREGYENSIWTKTVPGLSAKFLAKGNIGIIRLSQEDHFCYDTVTGEELGSILVPPPSSSWGNFFEGTLDFGCDYPSNHHDFAIYGDNSEEDTPISMPWYQGGWIRYPEGEHQHKFWLPNHWRPAWDQGHWIDNARVVRLVTTSGLVIIKL